MVRFFIALTCALLTIACGGESTAPGSDNTLLHTAPAQPQSPNFDSVIAKVDAFDVRDMALLIGNADEVLLTYEKGNFTADKILSVASASKLVFGLATWLASEDGLVSMETRPADILPF